MKNDPFLIHWNQSRDGPNPFEIAQQHVRIKSRRGGGRPRLRFLRSHVRVKHE